MTPERLQRIEELFHSALALEPDRRADLLTRACGGDEALRREVESLLESYVQAGSFIEQPAADVAAELLFSSQTKLEIGRRIGHYEIKGLLGEGGMGEVYLAWDVRLGRPVALKLLPAQFTANADRVRRFGQEARAASALNHPNIITVYDVGRADSLHFIAIEFVDGETLRQRIGKARLNLGEALDIATQIASALAAAHSAGIVHRDIKPENVMLRRDGFVKVLDFGLAKLAPPPATSVEAEAPTMSMVRTNPGVVMGTVSYMSPEQARGAAVDARSDIWSLGVVLYEMVAGRAPFAGETPSHTAVSILENEPPPLARHAHVPAELERIVRKALRKDARERYQAAGDLALDLKGLRQELEVEARLKHLGTAPTRGQRLVAETDGGDRHGGRKTVNSLAVLPFINASTDPDSEYLSDGITESIINSLSRLGQLRVMARSATFRYKGQEVDPQEIGQKLGVHAVLTGRVRQLGDRLIIGAELVDVADGTQFWGERYERKPSDIFETQEEIAREISDKLQVAVSGPQRDLLAKRDTDDAEAYKLYLKGTYYRGKWTEEGFKKSVEHFNQAIDRDPTYALAYAGLAITYIRLGLQGIIPQKDAYPKAKAAALKALDMDDALAEAHASLGFVRQLYDWDWPGARDELEKAVEINPNYADAHYTYCYHFVHLGQFDEAITEIKRAMELDPLSVEYMVGAADVYKDARQYDRAVEQCRKALEMDRNYGEAYLFLGQAYEYQGMYEEAIAEYQKAINLVGNTPEIASSLGHAYASSGRRDEAQKVIEDLRELETRRYVDPASVAVVYGSLGQNDEAFHWLEKAYEDRSGWLVHAKVEPIFDDLRADPRFTELLRRIGLAP